MADPPPRDPRKIQVPAPSEGAKSGPPPRPAAAPSGPRSGGSRGTPPPRQPKARTAPAPAPARPERGGGGKRRGFLPHRPKLRRVLLFTSVLLPILLLVLAVGGFIYARNVFNRIEKVEVADVLSQGGEGTNYLIVGSDSRDLTELEEAGLNPEAFEDGGGQRSDTIMLLRFADGGAKMMSIPRDLFVELAETGGSGKINAAYNGGPRRLILTVQQALNIPVHHYLEVDFVSFASLVDHLGGVTIEFPNPAFDRNSGLDVQQAGQVKLDGPQALAFVRSRNYVEVVDGRERADATGDLGRVTRQQQFLTAVLGKLGKSKNPYSVARAAGSLAGGLRIDDRIDLLEAARLAWRLRGVDPEPVVLPTDVGRNSAGSVLFLAEPEAETVLAGFR